MSTPTTLRSRLFAGAASAASIAVVCAFASGKAAAGEGFWQREAPVYYGVDDKPCRPPGGPCVAGHSKYDPGPPIEVRIDDASETHVTFGKRVPNRSLQPHWSRIKVWWQPLPAALRPGQKLTLEHGVEVQVKGWANFDSRSWIYRMSGPGGESEQLGSISPSDASAGLRNSTKLHIVPQGFGTGSGNEARLRYQIGAANGGYAAGKVVYSYKWIPGASAPPTADAGPGGSSAGSGGASVGPRADTSSPSAGGPAGDRDRTIHGTNPRERQDGGGAATPRDPGSDAGTSSAPGSAAPGMQVRNLALGRPVRQSSIYAGTGVDQGPQHAVDGKTGGRDPHDLIHTNYENRPWWQVDLGGTARIGKLRLFNRQNPQLKTCLKLVVDASDDGHGWRRLYTHDGSPWTVLDLPMTATGRFVRVALTNHDGLQLYEVEVWGTIPRMVR